MPPFILKQREAYEPRSPHPFYALDTFAKGYVEAMFFTNGDTADDDDDKLNRLGVERLTKQSVATIRRDCIRFRWKARHLLRQAYAKGYEAEQAGRDFWFTRQGHGVGFWDRAILENDSPEYERLTQAMRDARDSAAWGKACSERSKLTAYSLGERLSAVAKQFRECDVYTSRGWIHVQ